MLDVKIDQAKSKGSVNLKDLKWKRMLSRTVYRHLRGGKVTRPESVLLVISPVRRVPANWRQTHSVRSTACRCSLLRSGELAAGESLGQ